MDIRVDAGQSGPVFDGRAAAAVDAFVDEAEREIAREGVNIVRAELDRVLKHPTGYYRSQIRTDRAGGDRVVTDGRVVYGPWLAGVGSRNYPKTSFRGYDHWRRATRRIQTLSRTVAERVLPKYLRRME